MDSEQPTSRRFSDSRDSMPVADERVRNLILKCTNPNAESASPASRKAPFGDFPKPLVEAAIFHASIANKRRICYACACC
jgi:hypothetical protein